MFGWLYSFFYDPRGTVSETMQLPPYVPPATPTDDDLLRMTIEEANDYALSVADPHFVQRWYEAEFGEPVEALADMQWAFAMGESGAFYFKGKRIGRIVL